MLVKIGQYTFPSENIDGWKTIVREGDSCTIDILMKSGDDLRIWTSKSDIFDFERLWGIGVLVINPVVKLLLGETISKGTTSVRELFLVFNQVLSKLDLERSEALTLAWSKTGSDSEALLKECMEALGGYSPGGWYFGAHSVDETLFGYWEEECKGDV